MCINTVIILKLCKHANIFVILPVNKSAQILVMILTSQFDRFSRHMAVKFACFDRTASVGNGCRYQTTGCEPRLSTRLRGFLTPSAPSHRLESCKNYRERA